MQLEQRIAGDVAIITVTGDITLNKGGNVLLKDKVQSLLQQGHKNLLIDLSGVSYVDSAGLGELVQAYATTKNRGGALKLLNVTKRLKDLLVVTKLLTVFDAFDTEAAALASGASPAIATRRGAAVEEISSHDGRFEAVLRNGSGTERIAGNVAVIKVTGDITLNKGGDVLLKDKVQSLLQQGHKNLLIDLSGVSYVDSAGLGELVQAYATTKNRGGALKLLNVTKRLRDLLVVTKLLTVFDAYESEATALASFNQ